MDLARLISSVRLLAMPVDFSTNCIQNGYLAFCKKCLENVPRPIFELTDIPRSKNLLVCSLWLTNAT